MSRSELDLFRRGGAALALAALFVLTPGCSDSDPTGADAGEARIQVLLTDFPLEAIEAADVWISEIYLVGGGQGRVTLFQDTEAPQHFDLLELQDTEVELFDPVPVPEGNYGQLRFVVSSARITLVDGYTFSDGTDEKEIFVPSGSIRVNLRGVDDPEGENEEAGSLDLVGGETVVVLVDFDVSKSFVFTGPPTSPNGVLFKPVLKEMWRTSAPNTP